MSFAVYDVTQPRPGDQTPRGPFVPPWYIPHPDLSVDVRGSRGQRLGFTVAQVLPERRWAIAHDGRCVDQPAFEQKLLEWRIGQFQWLSPPKPVPDLTLEVIPTVEGFVSRGQDPANPRRTVDLTYPVERKGFLQKREPIIDESIAKDPRWKAAPQEDPKPIEEQVQSVHKVVKMKKQLAKIACPDCDQLVGGAAGLRMHRKHKHKDIA
jgi:hypothetical protein